jgi:outer membrane lipoprotein carrier protein
MVLFPVSLGAELKPLDELVAGIQESYDRAKDFKAEFVQETTIKSIDKVEREEGMVYFKKPKKMLWDYSKPKSKRMVINPTKAWLYIPQDNTVYIQDAKKVFSSQLIIRFLTGVGRLKDDFYVCYADSHGTDAKGNYVLELKPSAAAAGIAKLHLTVDKEYYHIIGCSLQDIYGNLTLITFRNIQINTDLDDSLFSFTPPPGATVQDVP